MARKRCKIDDFKYPSSDKISGRSSTICRSMACTLLEREACSDEEEKIWKSFFSENKCAYCGRKATHLDHLHPLIIDKKPTGYGTEPGNLVPCCGECNQPKGNMSWKEYMEKLKKDCETKEEKELIQKRIDNIEAFQKTMPPKKVILTDEMLNKWTEMLENFTRDLEEAAKELQKMHDEIYKK